MSELLDNKINKVIYKLIGNSVNNLLENSFTLLIRDELRLRIKSSIWHKTTNSIVILKNNV